jgi:hypothetical protein
VGAWKRSYIVENSISDRHHTTCTSRVFVWPWANSIAGMLIFGFSGRSISFMMILLIFTLCERFYRFDLTLKSDLMRYVSVPSDNVDH